MTEAAATGWLARAKVLVARFRALGGVPELCDLAWKLCEDNERLRAQIEKLEAETYRLAVELLERKPRRES